MIRIDLLKHTGVLTPNVYNQVLLGARFDDGGGWSSSPFVSGAFGNFVMPQQIGAARRRLPVAEPGGVLDVPAGRIDFAGVVRVGAPDAGWTEYPPISLQAPLEPRSGASRSS